jgi:hypothetical protein
MENGNPQLHLTTSQIAQELKSKVVYEGVEAEG